MFARIVLFLACVCVAAAFSSSKAKLGPHSLSNTRVYENFNLDFKKPEIVSDKLIFTEKQLREFTSTYSEDIRANPFSFITDLFASKEKKAEAAAAPQSKVTAALKSTISLAALEEKTAAFVKGSIDAKTFYKVLSVAFGDKLPVVLPEICNNLPSAKAAALKKLG